MEAEEEVSATSAEAEAAETGMAGSPKASGPFRSRDRMGESFPWIASRAGTIKPRIEPGRNEMGETKSRGSSRSCLDGFQGKFSKNARTNQSS